MKTNLKYVELDETQYWNKEFLERIGAKKVTAVYLFDANRVTNCCELTPSYELYYSMSYTDNVLQGDDWEEFDQDQQEDRFNNPRYYHCSWIDDIAKEYLDGENFEWEEEDDEIGDPYWLKMQTAAEDFERYNMHLI